MCKLEVEPSPESAMLAPWSGTSRPQTMKKINGDGLRPPSVALSCGNPSRLARQACCTVFMVAPLYISKPLPDNLGGDPSFTGAPLTRLAMSSCSSKLYSGSSWRGQNAIMLFKSESESCSVMSDSATPWTMQPMEFSRPEYWSG